MEPDATVSLPTSASSPRVPFEISDHIIDCLAPPPWINPPYYTPDDEESQRIRTLLVCTTVCHNWLPRARIHLYSIVWIDSDNALRSLTRTLESESGRHLLRFVARFVVAPRVWKSLDGVVQGYLPLGRFLAISPQVRHIVLCNFIWDDYPPLAHAKLIPPKSCIEHLQLSSVVFPGIRHLFALIYTLKSLVHLSMIGVLFDKTSTDLDVITMEALPRTSWAAPSLRVLEIGGPGQGIIPARAVRLLGNQIEHLRLTFHVGSPLDAVLPPFYDCVSTYEDLKTLRLTLHPWMSLKKPLYGSIDEGVQVWKPIHDFLLDLIRAVRSPALETLCIVLLSQQGEPEDPAGTGGDNPWETPCRYRHTRSGVLDALFTNDVRAVFRSHAFERLTTLQLVVYDHSQKHDGEWWKTALKTRIPDLRPGVVHTDVRYPIDSTLDELWEPEVGECGGEEGSVQSEYHASA